MKTNAFVAFLSMLLVVMYLLVWRFEPDTFGEMARFIPSDALLYIEQYGGNSAIDDFINSPLGKEIESIDFEGAGEKIGLLPSSLSALNNSVSFVRSIQDDTFVQEIFGKKFALAILSPLGDQKSIGITEFLKANSVVVAEPQHGAELLEFLGESYSRYDEQVTITTAQYGNHHIKRIKAKKQVTSLVTIDGFFIISLNEKQLRRCIDTFDAERRALDREKDFLSIRRDFTKTDRFVYLPIDRVRDFLTHLVSDIEFTGNELLLKELDTTVGFSALGYGSYRNKDNVVDKIIARYNNEQINSLVRSHLSTTPIQSSMLRNTTADPMLYYWSNTLNFKHFLLYYNDSTTPSHGAVKLISEVEAATGKNVEDILSLLGEEVSLILEPGSNKNFFPVPLGMMFVQAKDPQELNEVLHQLIKQYNIPIIEKIAGQIHYVYWAQAPQDGLQPLYGFWHETFFFGNSTKLLKKIIENRSEDYSLQDSPSVNGLDPGLLDKNNSITYLNNVELIKVFQKLLAMIGTIVGIEDQQAAYKAQVLIHEIINPLLDGLAMYDKSVTRSYFTPEQVVIDSITNIGRSAISQGK